MQIASIYELPGLGVKDHKSRPSTISFPRSATFIKGTQPVEGRCERVAHYFSAPVSSKAAPLPVHTDQTLLLGVLPAAEAGKQNW